MTLREANWTRTNVHHIVLSWLKAEGDRLAEKQPLTGMSDEEIARLLEIADLADADQNRLRLRLLYWIRNVFVLEIPPDTEWHLVRNLRHENICELRAVNAVSWTDPSDKNELSCVADRKRLPMLRPISEWETPILWGHDHDGPFTILEGNNRLVSYASSGGTDLDLPVFIGLSSIKNQYHLPDGAGPLVRDTLNI